MGWKQHGDANAKFILAAADRVARRDLVVVAGGARAYDVPLAELAERFERVVVTDVCAEAAEETVRQRVPEGRRSRVRVELFDLTGSYNQFVAGVDAAVAGAKNVGDAERALSDLCGTYDTAASVVRTLERSSGGRSRGVEHGALAGRCGVQELRREMLR